MKFNITQEGNTMNKIIKAEDVKVGDGIKTWFGTHTVVKIIPYTGPFDFILNILIFSNGTNMSNEAGTIYESL